VQANSIELGTRALTARNVVRIALGVAMCAIGVTHFTADYIFVQIVPPVFPAPYALVWVSGVAEIALGCALQFQRTRRLAGFGLVALYVAVFPANIYMTLANVQVKDLPSFLPQPSPLALWLRLPLQFAFIAAALWAAEIWPSLTRAGGTRPDLRGGRS
jgi:uncharacterized membrane protein